MGRTGYGSFICFLIGSVHRFAIANCNGGEGAVVVVVGGDDEQGPSVSYPQKFKYSARGTYRVVQMLTSKTKTLKTPNSRAIVYLRPIFSNRKAVKNNPEIKRHSRGYFQIAEGMRLINTK